jgi:hypothetical protein
LILLGNDRSKFKFLWRMAPDDEEEALMGKLHDAFAENIRSRSEAAKVRINVAAQVNACLVYGDDDDRKNIPTRVLSPKKEITGIRRRYLEALKLNIEARERY